MLAERTRVLKKGPILLDDWEDCVQTLSFRKDSDIVFDLSPPSYTLLIDLLRINRVSKSGSESNVVLDISINLERKGPPEMKTVTVQSTIPLR